MTVKHNKVICTAMERSVSWLRLLTLASSLAIWCKQAIKIARDAYYTYLSGPDVRLCTHGFQPACCICWKLMLSTVHRQLSLAKLASCLNKITCNVNRVTEIYANIVSTYAQISCVRLTGKSPKCIWCSLYTRRFGRNFCFYLWTSGTTAPLANLVSWRLA